MPKPVSRVSFHVWNIRLRRLQCCVFLDCQRVAAALPKNEKSFRRRAALRYILFIKPFEIFYGLGEVCSTCLFSNVFTLRLTDGWKALGLILVFHFLSSDFSCSSDICLSVSRLRLAEAVNKSSAIKSHVWDLSFNHDKCFTCRRPLWCPRTLRTVRFLVW